MAIFKRNRVPAEVTALVPKGERLMAWGSGPAQINGELTIVVATDKSFIAPGYLGPISWTDLARAEWSDTLLEVVTLKALQGEEPPVRINLDEPGSVPQVVWERIESRIILQRHIELVGKKGARIIAKRSDRQVAPGSDSVGLLESVGSPETAGEQVDWLVVFDAGIDTSDPELRTRVEAALEQIKAAAGI